MAEYTEAMKFPRLGGCLLGAALIALGPAGAAMPQLGPTSTSQAVNQINSSSMRPVPSVGPAPVVRENKVWVPARVIHVPGEAGNVTVPPHWERRLPGTDEVYVPSLRTYQPSTGTYETFPAGVRPPVEERYNSP
jgi:hypothetical protein